MVRQYLRIKSQHQDAILFYRMGDFYEMFFDDARTASRILNIALTSRDKDKENAIPLCGVPYHSADSYIHRLVKEGHKVVICEQIGEAPKGSKLVRREVIRIVTPGTVLSEGSLPEKKNNFLAAICPGQDRTGVAFLDISTGDFMAAQIETGLGDRLQTTLADFEPAEIIFPRESATFLLPFLEKSGFPSPAIQRVEDDRFELERAVATLKEQFGTATLEPFGLNGESPEAARAAGAALLYALDTQKQTLPHVRRLSILNVSSHLQMDAATQRNLELVRSAAHGGREGTLLSVLDETLTAMGGRLLRQWILRPLTDTASLRERLDAVGELVEKDEAAGGLRRALKPVLDLERLAGRISLGHAGPRDLLALRESLGCLPGIRQQIGAFGAPLLDSIGKSIDPLEDLHDLIEAAVRDDAPAITREGGFIKAGYHEPLDGWLAAKHEGRGWIADLEERERRRTGIGSLKVRYNRVFGYFIEITKANLGEVPADYLRKQTLVGAERFTTAELSGYETRILEADERSVALEQDLFRDICARIQAEGPRMVRTCHALAQLDVLQSLAGVAVRRRYCRPQIDDSLVIDIVEGRHPVVEMVNREEPFIPNDCLLDNTGRQMLVITGPNMAGKSTYLRQVALIVLMAQMGGFVPCRSARIGVVDRIFTRIGATDFLVRGQSTFMVEMTETALILNNATARSLVILDEIGRGTSTFDGLSIAWAVAEYLHETPRAKARTLFATHYHQLTELALTLEGVRNYSTAVREWGERIIFLRKIVEGGTDKSYGIQVARLAGLPQSVIARAQEIMANLEVGEFNTSGLPRLADHTSGKGADHPGTLPSPQLYLLGSPEQEVLDRIAEANTDQITPLDALRLLSELKFKLQKRKR